MSFWIFYQRSFHREDGDYFLVIPNTSEEVSDMATLSVSTGRRSLPCPQSVHSSFVGENQKSIFREASDYLGWCVFIISGNSLEALPSSVLKSECLYGKVSDVVVSGE